MRCRRILLVDDNLNDAELTLTALDEPNEQQEVIVMPGGLATVAYLENVRTKCIECLPDVILLDLNMPHMNGIEVLDVIRAEKHTRHIPVVMLSTSADERDIQACYEHGANAYVVKPLELDQFRAAMNAIKQFWVHLNRRSGAID